MWSICVVPPDLSGKIISLKMWYSSLFRLLSIRLTAASPHLPFTDGLLKSQMIKKQINKTTMNNALRLFKRYHLVALLDKELFQEESRIVIYDSILMAV